MRFWITNDPNIGITLPAHRGQCHMSQCHSHMSHCSSTAIAPAVSSCTRTFFHYRNPVAYPSRPPPLAPTLAASPRILKAAVQSNKRLALQFISMQTQLDPALFSPALIAEGVIVLVRDIVARPEFNGCKGKVTGPFNSENQRWPVHVKPQKGDKADASTCRTRLTRCKVHQRTAGSEKPTCSPCE